MVGQQKVQWSEAQRVGGEGTRFNLNDPAVPRSVLARSASRTAAQGPKGRAARATCTETTGSANWTLADPVVAFLDRAAFREPVVGAPVGVEGTSAAPVASRSM